MVVRYFCLFIPESRKGSRSHPSAVGHKSVHCQRFTYSVHGQLRRVPLRALVVRSGYSEYILSAMIEMHGGGVEHQSIFNI